MALIPPTPVWRSPCFAGLFGEAHLAGTELEGGSLRRALGTLAAWLGGVATNSADLLGPDAFLPAVRDGLAAFAEKLSAAGNIARLCEARAHSGLEDAVRQSLSLLSALTPPVGQCSDYVLLPGGWRVPNGGHAIMYAIIREVDAADVGAEASKLTARRFTFVVLNSGQARV